jgi:hypothetical protein
LDSLTRRLPGREGGRLSRGRSSDQRLAEPLPEECPLRRRIVVAAREQVTVTVRRHLRAVASRLKKLADEADARIKAARPKAKARAGARQEETK